MGCGAFEVPIGWMRREQAGCVEDVLRGVLSPLELGSNFIHRADPFLGSGGLTVPNGVLGALSPL